MLVYEAAFEDIDYAAYVDILISYGIYFGSNSFYALDA